jgi:hypothetical protein
VLDQLARAQAELTARGIELLNVAHAIGRNAVATFKKQLVNSLVQDNLLHDLEKLRTALAAMVAVGPMEPGLQRVPDPATEVEPHPAPRPKVALTGCFASRLHQ